MYRPAGHRRIPALEVHEHIQELGHCTRIGASCVLCALARGPVRVTDLHAYFGGAQSMTSSRLGVLRRLGLVEYVQRGREHYYTLTSNVYVCIDPDKPVEIILGETGGGQVVLRLPNAQLGISDPGNGGVR